MDWWTLTHPTAMRHDGYVRRPPQGWWDWLVLISYTFGPWILLWILGDHKQFRKAVGAGVLFALIASFLDDLGVSLNLWWYPEQPIPLMTGNSVWNIFSAAAEAILIGEKALTKPKQLWYWIVGLALANAAAEYFALFTTNLLDYPSWSPLFSIPAYILVFWVVVWYTRWVWPRPTPWKPPVEPWRPEVPEEGPKVRT